MLACMPAESILHCTIASGSAELRSVLATSYDARSFLNLDYGSCVSYIMVSQRCRFGKGEFHVV